MTFTAPEWFILIPAIISLGLIWRKLQLWKTLRILLIVLVSVLLADPKISRQQNALDLWVLLDRSDSTEDLIDKGLPEWKRLLEEAKPNRHDKLHIINYASEVIKQRAGTESAIYTGSRKLSRLKLALQNVLALSSEDRPSRILTFTDGYSTEPLTEIVTNLTDKAIPLDYRLVREESTDDYRIARFHTPLRTQTSEPFVIDITVRGHADIELPLLIKRNGQILTETKVKLIEGTGKAEFTDRINKTGSYEYTAEISPTEDAHLGNNTASRWIEVIGGPRVIVVSKYKNDPLALALQNQQYEVQLISEPSSLHLGLLAGAKAVIFNNVPAHEVPTEFQEALNFYVKQQGGSFLMVGGKQSFGSGGYFQSAIDDLLPISMELKNEHRKLSVAMAVVMDRSGSMGATAGGGKTKMDLANTGAARAVELLGNLDQITVFAVDSAPHKIVPLTTIGSKKKAIINKTRRVRSQGGGIYVYTGLKAAWQELKKSTAGTRHVILFSDAADSEEPGKYKALLKEMEKANCTVSVIGLGQPSDPDAAFLKDIAKRGSGRCFFTTRPAEIPRLFAQETVTIARSSFITDPVTAQATGKWSEVSAQTFPWLPEVDGYNLSYARPDASTSLISKDEYLAPLVAHARRGIGRTAAVSFPLGGEFSERARSWPEYGDFIQTLTQWLIGDQLPAGIGIRHRIEGTQLTVDLLYDTEQWSDRFAISPPTMQLIHSSSLDSIPSLPYEVTWQRISPGRFTMTHDLEEGALVRGAIQLVEHAISFGPLTVGSSTEWAFDSERLAELRDLSAQTQGRELIDLSKAWLRPAAIHRIDLRIPLTIAILVCILLEAFVTRTNWKLPQLSTGNIKPFKRSTHKKTKASAQPSSVAKPKTKKATDNTSPKQNKTNHTPPSGISRSSRFDRAKRRK